MNGLIRTPTQVQPECDETRQKSSSSGFVGFYHEDPLFMAFDAGSPFQSVVNSDPLSSASIWCSDSVGNASAAYNPTMQALSNSGNRLHVPNELSVMRSCRGHVHRVSLPAKTRSLEAFQTRFPPGQGGLARVRGKQNVVGVRIKVGSLGSRQGQMDSPHGFCLTSSKNEEIVVCDTNNHRVQVFRKNGQFVMEFGTAGKEEGQLWFPRKVGFIRQSNNFVVCDKGNERSRMQIFNKRGFFLHRIVIRYCDIVAGLAINDNGNIVIVDSVTPSCFTLKENGEQMKWFDCSNYMREPSDLAIGMSGEHYICDFKDHCVAVFNVNGQFLRRIGNEAITPYPNGVDISEDNEIVVGDSHGNKFHVAVFSADGNLRAEFQCPFAKVSRCCGLRITSDGCAVTVAKSSHCLLLTNVLTN